MGAEIMKSKRVQSWEKAIVVKFSDGGFAEWSRYETNGLPFLVRGFNAFSTFRSRSAARWAIELTKRNARTHWHGGSAEKVIDGWGMRVRVFWIGREEQP